MKEIYEFLPLENNTTDANFNLVMLHGYGSDAFNLLPVGDFWQKSFPNLAIYSLQAPDLCSDIPYGRQWFYIQDFDFRELYEETKEAGSYLERSLNYLSSRTKIPFKNTILMGFSQGAMVTLYTGIYRLPSIRGIMAYSGSVLCYDTPPIQAQEIDISFIYGNKDSVIPKELFDLSIGKFEEEELKVKEHIINDLDHSINNEGLLLGENFLKNIVI